MKKLFTKAAHTIAAGEVLAGIAHRPCTLRVLTGRAWITSEGEIDDHWLSAGQHLSLGPDQLIVVEADGAICQVEIACVNNRGALTAVLRGVGSLLRQPFYPATGGAS